MSTLSHSVIKLKDNVTGVKSIVFSTGDILDDTKKVEDFLRQNYDFENISNRVMILGTFKNLFEVFNDRGMKPVKIRCKVKRKNVLCIVRGELHNGRIFLNKEEYLESDVLHFGNISSDLGFKILTNSVVRKINLSDCEIDENFIRYDGLIYRMPNGFSKKEGEVTVLGRLAGTNSLFDVQVLNWT